jgi:hypothetical protein
MSLRINIFLVSRRFHREISAVPFTRLCRHGNPDNMGETIKQPAVRLQDFRSVHAYRNSTTLIPGYRRILLGISHLTQLNTS